MVRPTRVLIVDDAPQVRQELGRLLALACPMEVVGEATDGLEAVAQAAALGPDVVLLDLELRGWMASRPAVKPSRVIKERGLAGAVVLTIRVDLTSAQAAWAEPVALQPNRPYRIMWFMNHITVHEAEAQKQ